MQHITKRLKDAMVEREKIQELLSNIEQRRLSGTLAAAQYDILKSDYQKKMTAAVSEISVVKGEVKAILQNLRDRLNSLSLELEELRARYEAGEYSLRNYQGSEKKLLRQLDEVKRGIPGLQAMADSKSSSQLAGKYSSERPAFLKWAIVTLSILAAVIVICGGGFAVYKFALEPGGFRLPGQVPVSDNITPRHSITENVTEQASIADNTSTIATPQAENVTISLSGWEAIIAEAKKSIVTIKAGDNFVAGVLVSSDGKIFSSKHYVRTEMPITVEMLDKRQYQAQVTANNAEFSLIEVLSDNLTLPFLKIGDATQVKEGDEIAVLSPGGCKKEIKTSHIVKMNSDTSLEIDMEYIPCMTGSAVINRDGDLVAIVIGQIKLENGFRRVVAFPITDVNNWAIGAQDK